MSGHGDHSDLWNYIDGLREDLGRAEERIRELEDRCAALEKQTPTAQRLQYEADIAGADAAEYDRHGRDCGCPYCGTDEDEESPLARRDAYIGTWSGQDVTRT